MPKKTTDADQGVIGSKRATTSEDSKEVELSTIITSASKREVQLSIGVDEQTEIRQERNISVTQTARKFLSAYPNKNQAKQARGILKIIDDLLRGYDDAEFPEIAISSADDGTLGMQWDVGDTTLGIGIDPGEEESYWFLLSGTQDKDIRAKGNLKEREILIPWLIYLLEKKTKGY